MKNLSFSFQSFCDKLKNIQNIAEEKKAWLEDEENQASLKLLWKQTGRFLRHVCPRGGKGSVTFGFEEPYLTGQVLSAAALIYPFLKGIWKSARCLMKRYLRQKAALRDASGRDIFCGWVLGSCVMGIPGACCLVF